MPESPRTKFKQSRIVSVFNSDKGKLFAKKVKGKVKKAAQPKHALRHVGAYAWCTCDRWYRAPINYEEAKIAFEQHLKEVKD